jgi:polysaccharide biosynthesis transport protein
LRHAGWRPAKNAGIHAPSARLADHVECSMFEAPRQFKSVVLANADVAAAPAADIDLGQIVSTLWRGRTTILAAAALALLAAVLFVLVAPHRFTAVTEILIEPTDLRAVANEATPSSQTTDTQLLQVDSQVRVLTSDDVLRRVVEAEGLAHDPEFTRSPSALRALLDRVMATLGGRQALAKPDPSLAALNALRRRVQAKRAERTYVVDVSVSSEEAAKAARLANAVTQAYLAEQTEVRADAARQVSRSLTGRLNELKQSVQRAEDQVQAFKASHNIVGANGQLVNEQQLADLNNQLAVARARTAAAKARLDQIEAVQRSKTDVGAFPEAVQSQTITALRSQYAEVMRREAEQTTSLGDRHPAVIEIHAQAERLKRMIADEVNRIALAARTDYESARTNEDLLTRNVDALKQSTLATNAAMVTLRELERDVQASRAVYEAFLVRARETGEQERLDTKNIQVISKADLPMNRSSPPSSALIALGALFLGVAAGGGLVMMRASMPRPSAPRPGAASARQDRGAEPDGEAAAAELATGVPVLAVMPQGEGFAPQAVQNPRSRVAVAIRQVYDAVQASPVRPGNRSVMVVASGDDADAAAVAVTLAVLGATTQRVLLIDADLERRALSAIDADHGEAGLVDVAVGRRLLSEAVLSDRDSNLNVIPFISPNSRRDRRITDEDIRLAFAQTSNFDMVIVAATDVSGDPGARFFAGLVDHIVLVSQVDAADEGTVEAVLSALGLNARKVRGAVLTEAAAA